MRLQLEMGQTKARSQEFRSSLPCGRQAVQVLESSSGSLPRPSAADSRVDQLGHEQAHKRDAGATGGGLHPLHHNAGSPRVWF